jgi:hypothetical protein
LRAVGRVGEEAKENARTYHYPSNNIYQHRRILYYAPELLNG